MSRGFASRRARRGRGLVVFGRWWTTPPRRWARSRESQSLRWPRTASGSAPPSGAPWRSSSAGACIHIEDHEFGKHLDLLRHRRYRRGGPLPRGASSEAEFVARAKGGSAGRTLAKRCRWARPRRRTVLGDGLRVGYALTPLQRCTQWRPEAKPRSEPVTGSSLAPETVR